MAPLSEEDRALALRVFDRVAARPHAPDLAPIGCLAWMIALALLVVAPRLPGLLSTLLLAAAGLLAVGGLALRFFGAGRRTRQAGERARSAIEHLATREFSADREAWLEQAAVALCDAFYSGGPYTLHTYDFDAARTRLGDALPRMLAVETHVRLHRDIYPVFTDVDALRDGKRAEP